MRGLGAHVRGRFTRVGRFAELRLARDSEGLAGRGLMRDSEELAGRGAFETFETAGCGAFGAFEVSRTG